LGLRWWLGKESLRLAKKLKAKGLVKSWGTYGFIYRTGEKDRGLRSWHISRKTWKVERFPWPIRRRVVWDSKLSRIRLTGLAESQLGCRSGMAPFDY
jgi:hypothetical protein